MLPENYAKKNRTAYTGSLMMWNNESMIPQEQIYLKVYNPITKKTTEEVILYEDNTCTPILSLRTCEAHGLITINGHNFNRLSKITEENIEDIFNGKLGKFPIIQHLKTDSTMNPVIMANRRVPIAIKSRLKEAIKKLEKRGIIKQITEPTPWVSQLITFLKKSYKLRIFLDPHELNKAYRENTTLYQY